MNIEQIAKEDKNTMLAMLTNHLEGWVREMLEEMGSFTPFLVVLCNDDRPKFFAVPVNGQTDVDEVFKVAANMLKEQTFDGAIFCMIAPVIDRKGKTVNAIKSVVVLPNKMAGDFFTLYKLKGLFKKQPVYLETVTYNKRGILLFSLWFTM